MNVASYCSESTIVLPALKSVSETTAIICGPPPNSTLAPQYSCSTCDLITAEIHAGKGYLHSQPTGSSLLRLACLTDTTVSLITVGLAESRTIQSFQEGDFSMLRQIPADWMLDMERKNLTTKHDDDRSSMMHLWGFEKVPIGRL